MCNLVFLSRGDWGQTGPDWNGPSFVLAQACIPAFRDLAIFCCRLKVIVSAPGSREAYFPPVPTLSSITFLTTPTRESISQSRFLGILWGLSDSTSGRPGSLKTGGVMISVFFTLATLEQTYRLPVSPTRS